MSLPAGPLYAPSALPEEWSVQAILVYGISPLDGEDVTRFVVHPSSDRFEVGGIDVHVSSHESESDAREALATGLDHDGLPIDVVGMEDAQIEGIEQSAYQSLSGVVQDRHVVRVSGLFPTSDLVKVAEAISIDEGDSGPVVDLHLAEWDIEPLGIAGVGYDLTFDGPAGPVTVSVAPGHSRASLYLGGADLAEEFIGEVGVGYTALQRTESEGAGPPTVHWWVPEVYLTTVSGTDLDIIVEILDSFVEFEEDTFAEFISEATIETLGVALSYPGAGLPPSQPLAPATEAELVAFVEAHLGRRFVVPPEVTIVDGDELQEGIPEGTFVSEALWDPLLALELVSPSDDRVAADSVRREAVRGACCPGLIIDTGDPLLNEVVIVHELTHGLDLSITPGTRSVEPVDPLAALIEGNAHRVAFDYADLLNQQGASIADPPNIFPEGGDPRLPEVVQKILEFPYDEGRHFAIALVADNGEQGIVDAFSRPPTTSEQILDPKKYLAQEQATAVSAPLVPSNGIIRQQGSLGAFLIALMTEPQLGTERSLDLALTWAGDTYILYETPDATCLSATVELDDQANTQTFRDSLALARAEVSLDGNQISITNCVDSTP
ncbi:MAG: hypothetical protein GY926_20965 [bacterium]|nr:hypothetical protein [bacterium]